MSFECYCMPETCDGSDGYLVELRDSWQKARKNYRCVECQEVIVVGERYHRFVFVWEGSVGDEKHCEFCWWETQRINHELPEPIVTGQLACALVAELRGDL
jgi:hypothetical protein